MINSFVKILEKHWYVKNNWALVFLLPLTAIFALIVKLRFWLFYFNIKKRHKLPVPVVVIGNISVGGVGKTPITKHLATLLARDGIAIGIIMRGVGGSNKLAKIVTANDESQNVGDEALIYAKSGFKVAIGVDRYNAGQLLLAEYPEVELILADDGLQHYRLQRDYEIAVIENERFLGNQSMLPYGPLRESVRRLNTVDKIIVNLGNLDNPEEIDNYLSNVNLAIKRRFEKLKVSSSYELHYLQICRIYNPESLQELTIADLSDKRVEAMAAIGNPQRFFGSLVKYGINLQATHIFPDHYLYKLSDMPKKVKCGKDCGNLVLLVTEKDYTKLEKFRLDYVYVVKTESKFCNDRLVDELKQLKCGTKGAKL